MFAEVVIQAVVCQRVRKQKKTIMGDVTFDVAKIYRGRSAT